MKTTAVLLAALLGAAGPIAPQSTRAQTIGDSAPVVVKTVPEAGNTNLPAGEFEIKVTFNKVMKDHSWSWCTVWDDSTPPGIEDPKFDASHKTCSLKVKLEPGTTYGYWLNSEGFNHFQDLAGRPAVPYLLSFSTQGNRPRVTNQATAGIATVPAPASALESRLDHALLASPGEREAELGEMQRTISSAEIPAALLFLARRGEIGWHGPFAELASSWGSHDPAAALAWTTNLTDPGVRKKAIVSILKGWTDTAPKEAAAYVDTLPAGDLHDDAAAQVADKWSFRDAHGAAKWVSHFPAGAVRDKAMGPIIFWGQGSAPAAVIEMLDTIGDQKLIQDKGETVAQIWLQRDEVAARAWIKQSPLSEEVKQRLLNTNE